MKTQTTFKEPLQNHSLKKKMDERAIKTISSLFRSLISTAFLIKVAK